MTTDQVEFTEDELLASHDFSEPLIAGGVRCHGGFDDDGHYVSPRTAHRVPAIAAWEAQREEQFGTPLLDVPLSTWPEHYPNVAQARILLEAGVTEPISGDLTRIGTVEGFGGMIRHVPLPDLRTLFDEDLTGTATLHLGRGLYEAHARDEAGHGEEAGHKQMWWAARDVAFEQASTEDQTDLMLDRMGIMPNGRSPDPAAMRREAEANRLLPRDIPFDLEMVINRMVRLLLIEISAFHTFAWAEEVLADPDLVAGDGEAARLVSYIRADETPHVAYLKVVLTEMRDRTIVGETGTRHAGTDIVGLLWETALAQSLGQRRQAALETSWGDVTAALEGRRGAAELLDQFNQAGTCRRAPDGTWSAAPAA